MSRVLKTEPVQVIQWYCPQCGNVVTAKDEKCPHCNVVFAPIDNLSEEEQRIQEIKDKIEAGLKDGAKTPSPEAAVAEASVPVEVQTTRVAVPAKPAAEKKVPGVYKPQTGTRVALTYEKLQGEGAAFGDIVKEMMSKFSLDEAKATLTVKTNIDELKKARQLQIVEENGKWRIK